MASERRQREQVALRTLPPVVRDRLEQFAARERRVAGGRALLESLTVFCGGVSVATVALLAGLIGPTTTVPRVLLGLAVYGAAGAVLLWRGAANWRRVSLAQAAARFERAAGGGFEERLVSAVEFAAGQPPGTSAWMADQVVQQAATGVGSLNSASLVETGPLRRAVWRCLVGSGVLASLCVFQAPAVSLVLNPFGAPHALIAKRLRVSPGDVRLPAGEALQVQALAQPAPTRAELRLRWDDGVRERLAMERPGETNLFAYRFAALMRGCSYQVAVNGLVSPRYRIDLDHRPRVLSLGIEIVPPRYTGWPARQTANGDAEMLAGSRVRLLARLADSPPRLVELLAEGEAPQVMALSNYTAWADLVAETNQVCRLRVTGTNGAPFLSPESWNLRVTPDALPTASLRAPGLEAGAVTPGEVLLFEVSAQDDVGLKELELVAWTGATSNRWRVPLSSTAAAGAAPQTATGQVAVDLSRLAVEAGDGVNVRAQAVDLKGQTNVSAPIALAIVKPESAVAAQLAVVLRRALEQTDEIATRFHDTRLQWNAWGRGQTADQPASLAEVELTRARLVQAESDLQLVGTNLFAFAGRVRSPLAPAVAGLAAEISAWGTAHRRILEQAIDQALQAQAEPRSQAQARGRQLFEHATSEYEDLHARISLFAAATEAEALALDVEQAQRIYKRGLPVSRVALGLERGGATTNVVGLAGQALQIATNRTVHSLTLAAGVSTELARFTNDVPHADLLRLATAKAAIGPQLQTNLARFRQWTTAAANQAETGADELVQAARDARRLLSDQLSAQNWRWHRAPILQVARTPLEQVRNTAHELRPMAWNNKDRETLLARKATEFEAATAWTQELARGIDRLEQHLFDLARRPEATLAERAAAVRATLRLQSEAREAANQLSLALATAPTAIQMLERLDLATQKIDSVLRAAESAANEHTTAEVGRLAYAGLRQLQTGRAAEVQESVQAIAEQERRRGDASLADALPTAAALPEPKELTWRLTDLVNRAHQTPPSLAEVLPPPLQAGITNLQQMPGENLTVAEDLTRDSLGMAVESERWRAEGNLKSAMAYRFLHRDTARTLQQPDQLTPQRLQPLAERAAALAGQRGNHAREAELNAASDRAQRESPAVRPAADAEAESLASQLDGLASELNAAAANAAKRPEARADLDQFAARLEQGTDEARIAHTAAASARAGLALWPDRSEAYRDGSRTLRRAAGELRLGQANAAIAAVEMAIAQASDRRSPPGQRSSDQAASARRPAPQPQDHGYQRPVGSAAGLTGELAGPSEADWAKLRERAKAAERGAGLEAFAEEQRQEIRDYFKRLGEGK
jgi:hypothetical protein